jgi:hypothetical protein
VKHLETATHFIKVRSQELVDFVECWQIVHKEFKELIKTIKEMMSLLFGIMILKNVRSETLKKI